MMNEKSKINVTSTMYSNEFSMLISKKSEMITIGRTYLLDTNMMIVSSENGMINSNMTNLSICVEIHKSSF